jgi:hypothetical protein
MKNQKNSVKHKLALNWKKYFGEHRAFSWHEAKIKDLGWTYGVEAHYQGNKYTAWLELHKYAEPVTIIKKHVDSQELAELACEQHLIDISDKLQAFIKKNRIK